MEFKPLSPESNDGMPAMVRREVSAVEKSQGGSSDSSYDGIEAKRKDAWPEESPPHLMCMCPRCREGRDDEPDKDITARV